jgi:hypothetical protein
VLADRPDEVARFLLRALAFLKGAQQASEAPAARRKAAELLANGGNVEEALRLAGSGPRAERGDVLAAIALGLTHRGALDELDRLQSTCKDARERADLLLGAAEVLIARPAKA